MHITYKEKEAGYGHSQIGTLNVLPFSYGPIKFVIAQQRNIAITQRTHLVPGDCSSGPCTRKVVILLLFGPSSSLIHSWCLLPHSRWMMNSSWLLTETLQWFPSIISWAFMCPYPHPNRVGHLNTVVQLALGLEAGEEPLHNMPGHCNCACLVFSSHLATPNLTSRSFTGAQTVLNKRTVTNDIRSPTIGMPHQWVFDVSDKIHTSDHFPISTYNVSTSHHFAR